MQKERNSRDWAKIVDILAFSVMCLFIISPVIQIIRETVAPHKETLLGTIRTYPFTVDIINYLVMTAAIMLWGYFVMGAVKKYRQGVRLAVFLPLAIFGALAIWIYISQTVNGFTEVAYNGDAYRNESLFTFVLYLLGYFFLGNVLKSDKLRKLLCYIFLGANIIVGMLALYDHYVEPLSIFGDCDGMAAIFNQFNHYGYYLLMGILLSAVLFSISGERLPLRVFCAVVFITDNVILILNNTFGCYLAAIAALLFFAAVVIIARRNRGETIRTVIVLAAFIVISVVMHLFNHSTTGDMTKLVKDIGNIATENENAKKAGTGRWTLWTHTVGYIEEKPLFGWGVEGISNRLNSETKGVNSRPHNEYLQWAVFFGIPAAILYFAALCVIMFGHFPHIKKYDSITMACFIVAAGYIASAFVGNTMYYTAPFFFIFLGMTCRDRFYHEQKEEVVSERM